MRKCANISPDMRRPLVIYDFEIASFYFPYIWRKFDFLFYQCAFSSRLHPCPYPVLAQSTYAFTPSSQFLSSLVSLSSLSPTFVSLLILTLSLYLSMPWSVSFAVLSLLRFRRCPSFLRLCTFPNPVHLSLFVSVFIMSFSLCSAVSLSCSCPCVCLYSYLVLAPVFVDPYPGLVL
jgi:hypothetical protein